MWYLCLFIVWGIVTANLAYGSPAATPPAKARTVVRADKRSGRLVRTVVVSVAPPPKAAAEKSAGASSGLTELVDKTARAYDVDPLLVHSVIKVESNYNPYAVSRKGALGLMQLVPSTARRFGVSNSFDARQNVDAGVRYLRYLQNLFGNDQLAIAAYNAGEGAVLKSGGIPPFRETHNYVGEVGRRLSDARRSEEASKAPALQIVKEPEFRPLEVYHDSQGRVYLRTN
jgi:soluble lytic murein transglycosylase-like protein